MIHPTPSFRLSVVVVLILWVSGCASFEPRPLDEVSPSYLERSVVKRDGDVSVTVTVLSPKESEEAFGVALAEYGIQPVWLKIENREDVPYWFLRTNLDPAYFTPAEAAYRSRSGFSRHAQRQMEEYFQKRDINPYLPPGNVRSGFVFTNLDEGTKELSVELLGVQRFKRFGFVVPVPGTRLDHHEVDLDGLYREEEFVDVDEDGLRAQLEKMPCCPTSKKGNHEPLNVVLIGKNEDLFTSFIRSGWVETEVLHGGSAWKTTGSYFFGRRYRYAPKTPLFLYGRRQDLTLQKTRETARERNSIRLWLTPMRFEGKPVWIGQIGRGIGLQASGTVGVAHKIDPDLDEARAYLIEDLLRSQSVARVGWVRGFGALSLSDTAEDGWGVNYFTDGLRSVLFISDEPVSYEEVRFLGWESLPRK